MKNRIKVLTAIALILVISFGSITNVSATTYRTTTTCYWSCRAHTDCTYITFVSEGNDVTGDVYDKYFSGSYSHWPNAFTYGNTWSYKIGSTGYAKGTYTLYSSLITQWASIAFDSYTDTITHTY